MSIFTVKANDKRYDSTEIVTNIQPMKMLIVSLSLLLVHFVVTPIVIAAIFNIPILPIYIFAAVGFFFGRLYTGVIRSYARKILLEGPK